LGATIRSARANAEKAADHITWQGMQRRHDIAAKVPAAAGRDVSPGSPSPITAADWDTAGRATGDSADWEGAS